MLAKDMMLRRQNPITYPCYILQHRADNEEQLNSLLSKFYLFTYRTGFEPLPKTSIVSDKGWGCLARSCQMLLARALAAHCSAEFRFELFRDTLDAPFGLHNLFRAIQASQPAFWSPSQGCEAIRHTVAKAVKERQLKQPINVIVAQGGTIHHKDVQFSLDEMGAVLLLIPVRVGIKRHINQQTFMALENMMQTRLSVGVVGGVPRRSYYIIGTCGQRVLYLDPHVATKPAFVRQVELENFTETAQTLPAVSWDRIDTSLLFGFFLRSHDDWMELTEHVRRNTAMCGIERLFCIDLHGDGVSGDGDAYKGKRPEDCILTWDSSDEE